MQHYSLWLLPAPLALPWLAQRQAYCQARLDGPVFAPHLTLHGQVPPPGPAGLAALAALTALSPPVVLPLTGYSHSEAYFRAVVIEAAAPPALLALREAVQARLDLHDPQPYRPHLSLAYGDWPAETRAAMVAQLPAPPAQITLDRLSLVQTGAAGTTLPPDQWVTVAAWNLG